MLKNPHRGAGLPAATLSGAPLPSTDAARPEALLARCPVAAETPLIDLPGLADAAGVAAVWAKDERGRMGLGSFKALGAAYVIATAATEAPGGRLEGRTYVTASAGNHGMSVAAGARVFGAKAVIYIADTVPESFADRLRAEGARVVREGADYAASMSAAARDAATHGWTLLSDSSWPGYMELPHRLMEGYLAMAAEMARQIPEAPTHVFLQAGVGGLAGAVAAYARSVWGDDPWIIVVEPDAAPALRDSIARGRPVVTEGPASIMGRLDCKEPSLIALGGLARDADSFQLISEAEGQGAADRMEAMGLPTTPSGAAGVAGLLAAGPADRAAIGLGAESRVLVFLSEGAVA